MKINSKDSFKSLKKLKVDKKVYNIFSLNEAEKNGLEGISKLPKSLKGFQGTIVEGFRVSLKAIHPVVGIV